MCLTSSKAHGASRRANIKGFYIQNSVSPSIITGRLHTLWFLIRPCRLRFCVGRTLRPTTSPPRNCKPRGNNAEHQYMLHLYINLYLKVYFCLLEKISSLQLDGSLNPVKKDERGKLKCQNRHWKWLKGNRLMMMRSAKEEFISRHHHSHSQIRAYVHMQL